MYYTISYTHIAHYILYLTILFKLAFSWHVLNHDFLFSISSFTISLFCSRESQTKGTVDTIDDTNQYKEVIQAMKTMEMSQQEQNDLFAIVASVLHMGNVGFTEEEGMAKILKPASVDAVANVIIFT